MFYLDNKMESEKVKKDKKERKKKE